MLRAGGMGVHGTRMSVWVCCVIFVVDADSIPVRRESRDRGRELVVVGGGGGGEWGRFFSFII